MAVIAVCLALFTVIAIAGGIARFYFGDESLTLATLIRRLASGENIIQKNEDSGEEGTLIKASNGLSKAELSSSGEKTKLSLSPIGKEKWPADAAGGLYELSPSGEFKEDIIFKMTLNETPPDGFALGYWHPDTKKWEWLPTAKISDKTFAAALPHASEIGGGTGGACSTPPKDPENLSMTNEVGAEMRQVQIGQETGANADGNNSAWERAFNKAKELADKVINDYCKNRNQTTMHDFFAAWELMQCVGFNSLNQRFANAWENNCAEKEKIAEYEINQTEDYTAVANINVRGSLYQGNTDFKGSILYNGAKSGKASKEKPAWRGDWKVYSYMNSTSSGSLSSVLPKAWEFGAPSVNGSATDSYVFLFSLENVKEGETFSITQIRAGDYYSRVSGHLSGVFYIEGKPRLINMPINDSQSIPKGYTQMLTAVLKKDLGDKGAIIEHSSQTGMSAEQEKAMQQANSLLKNSGFSNSNNTWSWSMPGASATININGKPKPWRIFRTDKPEEASDENEDWQGRDENISEPSPDQQIPNDQNNDGVPDNEPTANPDADGDGIPDLAPMPSPGDADGDGLPDLAPLPTAGDANADGISDNQ